MAVKVTSTVKLNLPVVRRLDAAAKTALAQTADNVHTDLVRSTTMPRKTGALQGEKTFVSVEHLDSGMVELVSEGPYARRLYFHPEYNFHRETWEIVGKDGATIDKGSGNPNAGGAWFAPYIEGEKRDYPAKVYAALYRRNAGT